YKCFQTMKVSAPTSCGKRIRLPPRVLANLRKAVSRTKRRKLISCIGGGWPVQAQSQARGTTPDRGARPPGPRRPRLPLTGLPMVVRTMFTWNILCRYNCTYIYVFTCKKRGGILGEGVGLQVIDNARCRLWSKRHKRVLITL